MASSRGPFYSQGLSPHLKQLFFFSLKIEIKDLEWILHYPIWYMDKDPVPALIMSSPNPDNPHWKRIHAADFHYPIHILQWKKRLLILDGVHRLIKAKSTGQLTMMAKIINEDRIPEILAGEDDFETGFLRQFKNNFKSSS